MPFSSEATCAATTLTRARAASISSGRAPARNLASVSSAVFTRLSACVTRSLATSRLVAASSRCLREPELFLSSVSKRSRSCSAAWSSALRGGDFGARRVDLRLRLAEVLDARARLDEAQLRFGGSLLRLRAIDRELHVARVEGEHGLSGLHAIALLDRQREDAAARFRGEPRFRRFDMTGDAQPIARRFLRAGGGERASGGGRIAFHGASILLAVS